MVGTLAFYLTIHPIRQICSCYECFIFRAVRSSNKLLVQGYVKERMRSSLRKFYGWYRDLINQYEVPFSRMLHDILDDDHLHWHPLLMRYYIQFWLFYRSGPSYRIWLFTQLREGFHRTFATGEACQQRTRTPTDTWSCPIWDLQVFKCWDRCLLNLSCFRTFEFRTSIGTSLFCFGCYLCSSHPPMNNYNITCALILEYTNCTSNFADVAQILVLLRFWWIWELVYFATYYQIMTKSWFLLRLNRCVSHIHTDKSEATVNLF